MKKKYFLFCFLLCSYVGFSQDITITKIIETDCSDPFVKTVELYVDGTVNFATEVTLNYMLNGAPWTDNQIDISALGTVSDSFVYIVRDIDLMKAEFPSTTFDSSNTVEVATSTNGDDGYQIVLNGKVVSQFGKTETDADNDTIWEHDDSVVSRKSGITDAGSWDSNHWDFSGKNSLDGLTKCKGGDGTEAFLANLGGTYPLGSGSGWSPTTQTCTTILESVSVSCDTSTDGAANDTYTASINFANGNTGTTFTISSTAGTVGGDNPSSVATGTITISGIAEGTDITVTVNDTAGGGVCDLSTAIESPSCIPLVINEVLFDPASDITGDANGDGARDSLQDEFIELFNNSSAPLDISGFTLSDAAALRHTFPSGTIIPANNAIVVFGGGTPTGSFGDVIVQTASEGELNFSNSSDTITIKNTSEDTVLVYDSSSTGISHSQNQSVTRSPDLTGSFVLHTDVNSSLLFSPGLKLDGAVLSTVKNNIQQIGVYPNPLLSANRYLNISSNSSSPMNVTIFDIIGKQIIKETVSNNQLNVSKLETGIYLVKISQDGKEFNQKIIKN